MKFHSFLAETKSKWACNLY